MQSSERKKKTRSEAAVSSKIAKFRQSLNSEKAFVKMYTDVTLFANFFFKNPDPKKADEPFIPYAWQDEVFQDRSQKVVVCTSRQIGKTTMAALLALHHAYFNRNATVVVASETYPQALEVMKRINDFVRSGASMGWQALTPNEKERKAEIRIQNEVVNKIKTHSRIISVVASDSARGFSPSLVICDEAAFWEDGDRVFSRVFEPMVLATKGRMVVISTPNGQQGFFYGLFNSNIWSRHHFDWRANPDNTEEEIMKLRADHGGTVSLLAWESEYGANFVSPKNAYFTKEEIDRATKDFSYSPARGEVVISIDVGKHHDNAVIMVGCREERDKGDLKESVIRVVEIREKPLGTKYSSLIGEVKALHQRYGAVRIMVDATGSGEGPGEFLQSEALPVELVKFSIQKKAQLYSTLKVLMEDKAGRIKMPADKKLVEQVGWMMYEYTESGNIKIYPPGNSHDDYADALALLAYGLHNYSKVSFSVVSGTGETSVSGKKYTQVCDEEKGGCGEYFTTAYAERHFESGKLCHKCNRSL